MKCQHCLVTLPTDWIKTAQQVSKDPKCPQCGKSVITDTVLRRKNELVKRVRSHRDCGSGDFDGFDMEDLLILYLVFGDAFMSDDGFDESFAFEEHVALEDISVGGEPVDVAESAPIPEPEPIPEPTPEPIAEVSSFSGGYDSGGCDSGGFD